MVFAFPRFLFCSRTLSLEPVCVLVLAPVLAGGRGDVWCLRSSLLPGSDQAPSDQVRLLGSRGSVILKLQSI